MTPSIYQKVQTSYGNTIVFIVEFSFQHFQRRATSFLILVVTVLSCALAGPAFSGPAAVLEQTVEMDGQQRTVWLGPVLLPSPQRSFINSVWAIHIYGLLLCGVFMYALMLGRMRRSSRTMSKESRSRLHPELRLLYAALLLFGLNTVFAIYFYIRQVNL